jgi:hypothetical protein
MIEGEFEVFKKKYKNIVKEFQNKYCHPICGVQCKFSRNEKKVIVEPIKPLLYRQTQYSCLKCREIPISLYEHRVCHRCATFDDVNEFEYHHQQCVKNKKLIK